MNRAGDCPTQETGINPLQVQRGQAVPGIQNGRVMIQLKGTAHKSCR